MGATGLEPVTPSVSSKGTPAVSTDNKELKTSQQSVCTSEEKTEIETLARELLRLSPEDREKLAALLLGTNNATQKQDGK